VIVTAAELAEIQAHAEADYPRESCGVVLTRGTGERLLVRCRNVQDLLHESDPVANPRDARTAYYIDPKDLLRIGRHEAEGYRVAVIYHSHCDAGAYFSETDKRNAVLGSEPAYPETIYLVTSVGSGRAAATAAFRWHAERRDFLPVALEEPRS
jgi:proteasome lid subunit RPN8/RPN11